MAGRQEGWEATFRPPVVSVERYSLIATSPEPGGALESPVRSPLGSPVSHTHMAQSNLRIRFLGAFHGLRRVTYHAPAPTRVHLHTRWVRTLVIHSGNICGCASSARCCGLFLEGLLGWAGMLSSSAFLACSSAQTHLQYQTIWCLG